ncbi:hypothetical protein F3I16_08060 [Pseudomonas sp. L-22-4S-12]|uniref:hypothetical protein n=1 Tax=Pseudomonas sp. L-22-4S-12 TaxID=2610893 RepID=UPI00132AA62B|nr:hypothetical protein [Pseudomonas sp. L-22-4S-12]MWV16006.1 hypothetical protein [Pseudomonas sp. L-22-4S-12]
MSKDSEAGIHEILSDLQRIELLEQSAKLNRLLIYALGGGLLLALLGLLLLGLLGGGEEAAEQGASQASVAALEKKLETLDQQVASLKQQAQNQQKLFDLLKGGLPVPAFSPAANATDAPSAADRATVQQVAKTLIGQERSYQESLAALKLGMRDLAGMIAGSRSWLEDYQEALDKPLNESRARVKELQQWSAAEQE